MPLSPGSRLGTYEILAPLGADSSDSQWLGWLKNDRTFDSLRSEPRFAALVK